MTNNRISKHVMMMRIAHTISRRSACKRLRVGALITPEDMSTILSMGYNGPARGMESACPNDPTQMGGCGCVHAEMNALMKAPYGTSKYALFTTVSPCEICARLIVNSSVSTVYFANAYRDLTGLKTLLQGNLQVWQISPDDESYVNVSFTNFDDLFQR